MVKIDVKIDITKFSDLMLQNLQYRLCVHPLSEIVCVIDARLCFFIIICAQLGSRVPNVA